MAAFPQQSCILHLPVVRTCFPARPPSARMTTGVTGIFQYFVFALTLWTNCIEAGSFTFPTPSEYRFIVGDDVNVTWDVVTPRISLYELCEPDLWIIALNATNNNSYVWTATRDIYRESGCTFELEPLSSLGEPNGQDNVTSVTFGVAKRYHDDPSPTSYNFASSPSASSTGTPTAITSSSTTIATATTSSTVSAPASPGSHGLSSAAKIGIGLGVPLGVLLVAAIVGLVFFCRRRRRARKEILEVSVPSWQADEIAPLPTIIGYGDGNNASKNTRVSQADTLVSELSSENYRTRDESQVSELMGVERSELDSHGVIR
ncbi:hypothetical protein BBP40_003401 [Aspergillus hancockii]|nr:hypothetical protein BBP40_003401 [Aspergillus hancockii]